MTLEEIREKGLPALFGPELSGAHPLVVELGFGRGEFLRHLAAEAPGTAHLGVELSFKRVLKMSRRIAREGDPNIRLIEARAEEVVPELPDAGVAAFWINFSDPWPKKRHHRRRLVQPALVETLSRKLEPGGHLDIATDHVDYAEHIDAVLKAAPGLRNRLHPVPFAREMPGRRHTAYEDEWRAEGRPLHFFCYARRRSSAR